MPGIVGVIKREPWGDRVPAELQGMAEPLRYASTQTVQSFVLDRCAAAVVEYGKDFAFLKPAAAEREGVRLWMEGEVFPDAGQVPHELASQHPTIQRADYCLHLYLESGPGFVRQLNGSFAIAVFDGRDAKLHLFTDRFASRTLFVWHQDGECAFASAVRSLLNFRKEIGRTYDRLAVAELIGFERVFGEKTLFPDIRRLPSACRATWDGKRLVTERYMQPVVRESIAGLRSWRDGARELLARLRRAIEKRIGDQSKAVVFLSGGLDSRLVLAVSPRSVMAVTFANKGSGSDETRVASAVAESLGVPCLRLERDTDYYAQIAESATEINDGLSTFVGCHTVGTHQQMIDAGIQVALTGMLFDAAFKCFFGKMAVPDGLYPTGPAALRSRRVGRILVDTTLIRRADRQDLMALAFTDAMKDVLAVAREQQVRRLAAWFSNDGPVAELADCFPFDELQSAGGFVGFLRGIRTTLIDRSPIYENDLVSFGLSIPLDWKLRGRLVRRAIRLLSPELAWIKDANTGLPAGLGPLGDRWLGGARAMVRAVGRRLAGVSKVVSSLRQPAPGCRVFTQGAWHDLNGALRLCPAYRALVEASIDELDPTIFDVARIRALLKDDLEAPAPRLNSLFEMVITFSVFDRKWGPRLRTSV